MTLQLFVPSVSSMIRLAVCFYITLNAPCFAHFDDTISQLKHVRQSLELAQGESVLERAYEVLKYGIAPLVINVALTAVGIMKVARIETDTDYSPMPYLMVPHPLGFWSDYMTVVRQARDLGERPEDAIVRLSHGALVASPFLPIISIYRIVNRERELENKVRELKTMLGVLLD